MEYNRAVVLAYKTDPLYLFLCIHLVKLKCFIQNEIEMVSLPVHNIDSKNKIENETENKY